MKAMPIVMLLICNSSLGGNTPEPQKITITVPLEEPEPEPKFEMPPMLEGSCATLNLDDGRVSTHVQTEFINLYNGIVADGFTITQLEKANAAVNGEVDVSSYQKRGKDFFLKRVSEPLILVSGTSPAHIALRKHFRAGLKKIDASVEPLLGGDEGAPFNINVLKELLAKINVKRLEIESLKSVNAKEGNEMEAELRIGDHFTRLQNAVSLLKDTSDNAQQVRKTALAEYQRALSKNESPVMPAKCRVWETLR